MPNTTTYYNANLVTCTNDSDYGIIENGVIVVEDNKIKWLGTVSDLPNEYQKDVDLKGRWVTPALIDCHTHCVYAGNRAKEFEMRLTGISYEDIAKQGGGIVSTVKATRAASEDELLAASIPRVEHLIAEGVGVIEIKSGYGLDLETELKMLRVARKIGELLPITVRTTFLGAHALPAEYQDKQAYIDYVCDTVMPAVVEQQLADHVDVFCESIGFDIAQTKQVLQKAHNLNLAIKIHAEQLNNLGGSLLAAEYGALSCDHLEYLDEAGVKALAKAGTVATLLPGAFYFLKETKKPPIDLLRQHNVPMAIATDCNPGSSPTTSLLLMMNMACTLFGMTPLESLLGVTKNAAKALGLDHSHGQLAIDKTADFVAWDIEHPAELSYRLANNPQLTRYKPGDH
ncbi:MAG: imidazolonepropionase [Coxiellaceae bacterium]|nr:imidazolonepropionase [Coxiellaceae bacterium]